MVTTTNQSRNVKAKGRKAENAVAEYFKAFFPAVERRRLNGIKDRGDLTGIPFTVIEVKDHNRIDLADWVNQLEAEVANDAADVGAVIHKRRGKTDVGDWYATMPVRLLLPLLIAYANPVIPSKGM